MMDAKSYRRHLDTLGLTISGKVTTELLGIDDRTSRGYASLGGDTHSATVPAAIELALRLMVKHKENPEWWAAAVSQRPRSRAGAV